MAEDFRCKYAMCRDIPPFKNERALHMHDMRVHNEKTRNNWRKAMRQLAAKNAERNANPKPAPARMSRSDIKDAILATFSENPGQVMTRADIIDAIRKRGVRRNLPSLKTAVNTFLRETDGIDRVQRGKYIQRGASTAPAPSPSPAATATAEQPQDQKESPEVVLYERDYYRNRCQRLEEMVVALVTMK
jgi:hypothetical protein